MQHVHLDFETRSEVNLKKIGLYKYAEHPSTEILCMCYTLDGVMYSHTAVRDADGMMILDTMLHDGLDALYAVVEAGALVYAHNAIFEFEIWNNVLSPRFGAPKLKIEQMRCSMARCYMAGLPGALGDAARALAIDAQKDNEGSRLMLKMCKPRSLSPTTWIDDADSLVRLTKYCVQDVIVEQAIDKLLPNLSDTEQRIWQMDAIINARGIYVDMHCVQAAAGIMALERESLNSTMRALTNDAVNTCASVKQFKGWLASRGVLIDSVSKASLKNVINENEKDIQSFSEEFLTSEELSEDDLMMLGCLPNDVVQAIELRQIAASTSPAKLAKMLAVATDTGNIRGIHQYHAAGTGRWGGRIVQCQNLPRPKIDDVDIDRVFEIFENTNSVQDKRDEIHMLYDNVPMVIASCLRGMLVAPHGKVSVCADYSSVESIMLAWAAGEQKKLDIFIEGKKVYEATAAAVYGVAYEDVTNDQRMIGKVAELACGYGGSKGAFANMAKTLGIVVPDGVAERVVRDWRNTYKHIVQYWYAVERAAVDALRYNRVSSAGPKGREVRFAKSGSFLLCKLPSGRVLYYPYPLLIGRKVTYKARMDEAKKSKKIEDDTNSSKFARIGTYGSKLVENIVQAICRDLLAHAMLRIHDAGYKIDMHVHDEIKLVSDVDCLSDLTTYMCDLPDWAQGAPIKAVGWVGKRFRK